MTGKDVGLEKCSAGNSPLLPLRWVMRQRADRPSPVEKLAPGPLSTGCDVRARDATTRARVEMPRFRLRSPTLVLTGTDPRSLA